MKKYLRTQIGRFLAGLIALLLVAAVSAGAQKIPFIKADVTMQKVMAMSDTSFEIVKGIDEQVVISYLATEDTKEIWLDELARKYAAAGSRITYEMISPSGSRAAQLAAKAGETAAENMMVVSCGDRAAAISAEEMYSTKYNDAYLRYYGEYVMEEQRFIADEQLANALLYVTRDDMPVVYALTGHGETAAAGFMIDQFRTSNIIVRALSLTDAVPEDAAAVMILAPQADLTGNEASAVLAYLKNGGSLILATGYMMEKMPNLERVTSFYGMNQVCGVVIDPAAGYCYSSEYPQYITPDLTAHAVTATLTDAGVKATFSMAGGIGRNTVNRSGLTVTGLAVTSDQAYMKISNQATTLEMEDGDPAGPFTVAMAAEEGDTRVVWYASGTFLGDNDVSVSGGFNLYLLNGALAWMMPIGDRVTIEAEDLLINTLSVPAAQTNMVLIGMFIPALLALIVGVIVKKKK